MNKCWQFLQKYKQVFNLNGYKHDAGPTVITAPFMFDDLYKLFGEERKKYENLIKLYLQQTKMIQLKIYVDHPKPLLK